MKSWKPRFELNKTDQIGVLFFLLLVFFSQVLRFFLSHRNPLPSLSSHQLGAIEKEELRQKNVNFLSDFELYVLGISAEEAKRYRKYRLSGGWFDDRKEFKKELKISDSLFQQIEGRLFVRKRSLRKKRSPQPKLVYELNESGPEDFQKIRGIGPVLSKRIVSYRHALGGFVDQRQLYEVYGLDSSVAQRALGRFQLQKPQVYRYIHINEANEQELERHPYISQKQARRIVMFRELQEMPLTEADLRILLDVSSKRFNRIRLYLYF